MKTGTIEPIIEEERFRLRRSRRSGGGPNGGNGSNGGRDDGGDDFPSNNFPESENATADKSRVITWFLLLIVLMTFGGMIGAYVVISTNKAAEWRPFDLPIQIWISTTIILLSSISYHFAKSAVDNNRHSQTQKWLITTTVLGAMFISSQLLVWLALVERGFYMAGNPYAGFFYILTGVHAIHVIGGIIALGAILLRSWYPTSNKNELAYRQNLARSVGWYWHFMGCLWIALFLLLGFWK